MIAQGLLLFSLLVLIWLAVQYAQTKKQRKVAQRLKQIMPQMNSEFVESIIKHKVSHNRWQKKIAHFDALFSGKDKLIVTLLVLALPFAIYQLMGDFNWKWQLLVALLGSASIVIPYYLLLKKKQSEAFEKGIVQVLGLVSRAVSAGLSVPQAIEQVAQSQDDLLGREFSRIATQLSVGVSLRKTLDEACARLPYPAFRYFSVTLILNQSNGGQLRDILHNLSRTMHDNRAMRKKVKSLTSEPRMTATFLSLMPLFLLSAIAWLAPDMFDILAETEDGHSVLIYCATSIIIGITVLQSMTKNRKFS